MIRNTFLVVLCLCAFSSSCRANVIYVRQGVAGSGSSWSSPKESVAAAIAICVSGDQIWVGAGCYYGCITIPAGVALLGGFPAEGGDLSSRNPIEHQTILDGQGLGSVVSITAPGSGNSTRLDGFTLRNGIGTLVGTTYRYGGAVYCYNTSPVICHNRMSDCTNGGIYCKYDSAVSESVSISENVIEQTFGTGITCTAATGINVSPQVTGNTVNRATATGYTTVYGIYSLRCNSAISGNTVLLTKGTGISTGTGACVIANNTVKGGVNGISCSGSASLQNTIVNNVVIGTCGPGINCGVMAETSLVANNTVCANSMEGIYTRNTFGTVANNLVANNAEGINAVRTTTQVLPTLSHNCIAYNWPGGNYIGVSPGTGDIVSSDPDIRIAHLDYGDVHVQPGSVCIGSGDSSVVGSGWEDMDGEEVPTSGVDIGADQCNGTQPDNHVTVRVATGGDDEYDGSSWLEPKATIQAAISAASLYGGEVWVAGGTYLEKVSLSPFVHVYGGFTGQESQRSERPPFPRQSGGPYTSVIDYDGQSGSLVSVKAGHFASTIDGFTIQNGQNYGGAGIYCDRSSAYITNNIIRYNYAMAGNGGGGITLDASSSVVSNNLLLENSAWHGSAIQCQNQGTAYPWPVITNNVIADNYILDNQPAYVRPTIMLGNTDSAYYLGFTIANNTIVGNTSAGSQNYAIWSNTYACPGYTCQVTNNIIAYNGGGVYWSRTAVPSVSYNCVYGNSPGADYNGLSADEHDVNDPPEMIDWSGGNYHLLCNSPGDASPCIGSGSNEVAYLPDSDFEGDPRILPTGGTVDIGADEYRPTVTLEKATGQSDPTSNTPIWFVATFNEPVSGFGSPASDVLLGGTAAPTKAVVTDRGDHRIFDIAVSGMAGNGTVQASIPAGAAADEWGIPTAHSTSQDDTVVYSCEPTAGTPLITDPTANETINDLAPIIHWSASGSWDRYQVQLWRVSDPPDPSDVWDSGVVISCESFARVTRLLTDGVTYRVKVQVGSSCDQSEWSDTVDFTVEFTEPPLPDTVPYCTQ